MNLDFVSGNPWNFVLGLIALLSAVFSVVAIYVALDARAAATRQLTSERRRDFEIEALLRLLDRVGQIDQDESLKARLLLVESVEIPATRWAAGLIDEWPLPGATPAHEIGHIGQHRSSWAFTTPSGEQSHRVARVMQDELVAAIRQVVSQHDA